MKPSEFLNQDWQKKSQFENDCISYAIRLADEQLAGESLREAVEKCHLMPYMAKNAEKYQKRIIKLIETARAKADKANRKGLLFIKVNHRNHSTIYAGSLQHLIKDVFGYTLECGNSWNNRIPRYPKNKSSLVSALNHSADETRHYFDSYEAVTEEEYTAAGGKLGFEYEGDTEYSGSVTIRHY